MAEPVLTIRDLAVEFSTDDGVVHAVDGISYDVYPGETLGIVGESGSGKSVSTLALLGLIPQPPGRIVSGTAMFKGKDLLKMKRRELRRFRGDEVAMVFQQYNLFPHKTALQNVMMAPIHVLRESKTEVEARAPAA